MLLAGCGGGGSTDGSPGSGKSSAARPSPKPAPVWNRQPDSIAALGDSITVGFDACSVLADCPEVSWSTGTDAKVDSLASRLLKKPAGHSWNHAVAGARMADLPQQVTAAIADRPELVTVMLGANDACTSDPAGMTSVADFRADFTASLRALRAELPKTQVYVASVPDLMRLWSEGRENALGKQVWKLGICQSILRDPDATDQAAVQRRQSVQDRVVAYNSALKEICGADKLCRYDGGAVFGFRFTGGQLSKWDWFHPSKEGQGRLAELAYRQITRPGTPA
ncbi:SGNH/GDSL hydrolase family protein [Streptomyces sp. H27-D2]|uniref:SGNH/GDSL hydrolase family protein n=1 Tax=Streptomyces sp. H27-D2 TaxID=3046304 RepID=UPI002DB83EB1|nr:SGNH/GDSL hydrolase family protein [Streptomyces sp. H27-D2]MEC4016165.1 SGNH/GDSL hydrolase family protein [Streptomyces sp. H27-D2]